MDLALFARVLWRFRYLVGGALALGLVLAFITYQASGDHQRWTSESTIFVTQKGFPEGRVSIPIESAPPVAPGAAPEVFTPQYADPSRLTGLATLYAALAESDQVRALVEAQGPVNPAAVIDAQPVVGDLNADESLPLVTITTEDATAQGTLALTERVTQAFSEYLRAEQERNDIPDRQRVLVEVVKQPGSDLPGVATQVQGRSLTRPLVLFLALAIAAVGLAFILENLRPQRRPEMGLGPGDFIPDGHDDASAEMDMDDAPKRRGRSRRAPARSLSTRN